MLLTLGLSALIFLVLLLPQAQASRYRFVPRTGQAPHIHHTHAHPHRASSSESSPLTSSSQLPNPHIQMVTGSDEELSEFTDVDIAMVSPPQQSQLLGRMPVSGPNPGANSQSLAVSRGQSMLGTMLDTPVSGPNPDGNSESLLASGPHLGGSSNTLTSILDTPVSGPIPSGNTDTLGNMLDTPVSGPNPGANSQVLTVSAKTLTSMLDTPVSGPNPSGNSQTLTGYNSETLTTMLDTPVSGPNPGENSQSLTVSGSGGGVAEMLATMLDTPVSGPNPGGNSQILFVAVSDSRGSAEEVDKSLTDMSDTPLSGLNSESSSATLGYMLDTPVSGPNPSGNSQILSLGLVERSDHVVLSAVSGPNPGSISTTLTSGKDDVDRSMGSSSGLSLTNKPTASKRAEANTLLSELPRMPVPPSGPNPIHNLAATNQGLFAGRNLKSDLIGCEQEGARDSDRVHHFEASRSTINFSMAGAGLSSA